MGDLKKAEEQLARTLAENPALLATPFSYRKYGTFVILHENGWKIATCPHCGAEGKAQIGMQLHIRACDMAAEKSLACNPKMREEVRSGLGEQDG